MQVISNAAFEQARASYTRFAIHAAHQLAREVGFSYEPMDVAPGSNMATIRTDIDAAYDLSMTEHLPFPVWNGACEGTVFLNKEGNWAFRFWHDVVSHCAHGLGFDTQDEMRAGMQWVTRVANEFGAQSIEAMIAYADTCGQTLYCQEHGEFPEDQLGFCRHCLNVGEECGTLVSHEIDSQRAALAV